MATPKTKNVAPENEETVDPLEAAKLSAEDVGTSKQRALQEQANAAPAPEPEPEPELPPVEEKPKRAPVYRILEDVRINRRGQSFIVRKGKEISTATHGEDIRMLLDDHNAKYETL